MLASKPKPGRLRHRAEFLTLYGQGSKAHGRFMTLFVLPNRLDFSRLGVAATKKIGGAVTRNRAKRRIREMFRLGVCPSGLDVVVVARRELAAAPWPEIVQEFQSLMQRRRRTGGRT